MLSFCGAELPEDKVAELLTDLFLKRVTTRLSRAFGPRRKVYKNMKADIMGFLRDSGAARAAANIVLGNNSKRRFTGGGVTRACWLFQLR